MRFRISQALRHWFICLLIGNSPNAGATQILGPTYPIVEPDTAEEIRQKASAFNWQAWMTRDKSKFSAFQSAVLPVAKKNASRLFDPTYALPRDLISPDGRLLFPKGFKVNVYKALHIPGRYIVVQATDEDYKWLMEVAKPTAADKVLLASGNVYLERQKTHLPLLLLDDRFIERFGLKSAPAIVSQEGDQLRINEFLVKGKT